jgi:hypothetical protein
MSAVALTTSVVGQAAAGQRLVDLSDDFHLSGLFLLRHVLEPRGQGHSDAREGFINAVATHRDKVSSVS